MALTWDRLSRYRSEIMGAACLWVMLHHNFFHWPALLEPLRRLAAYGNAGVDIFLLLSGMGLSFSYAKKPALSTFYARRMVRLLIPYCLIAVPYWIWRDLMVHLGDFLLDVTQLSLPLQGLLSTWYVPAMAVFYLLFPAIHTALEKRCWGRLTLSRGTVTLLLCAAVILGCLAGLVLWQPWYNNCEIALTRLAVFIVGCALAEPVFRRTPLDRWQVAGCAAFIPSYFLLRHFVSLPAIIIRFSYIAFSLAICVVLMWALERTASLFRLHRFLRFFGERSLELYLSHVLIRNIYCHYLPVDLLDPWGVLSYAAILLLAVAVSTLLHPINSRISAAILRTNTIA